MRSLILFLVSVLTSQLSLANSFEEGIQAFNKKEYKKAIEKFNASIEETPTDASSFFNLGLSFQKNKQFGKAIWAFEKANQLTPNDAALKTQIQSCYEELGRAEEYSPRLNRMQSALFGISSNQWSIIAIITSILFAICWILFVKSSQASARRLLLSFSFLLVCILIVSIYTAKTSFEHQTDTSNAIVTQSEIPIFSSDKAQKEIGTLPEGTRLYMLEIDAKLISVESVNGEVYLINPSDVEFI